MSQPRTPQRPQCTTSQPTQCAAHTPPCYPHHDARTRTGPPPPAALSLRYWSFVDMRGGAYACWPYIGTRTSQGYGHFRIGTGVEKASRVALHLMYGYALRDEWQALHTCDNPPCCNPRHLFAGSSRDNMDDKVAKGRQLRGVTHSNATITEHTARLIRDAEGRYGDIALRYGTTSHVVRDIKRGRSWMHLRGGAAATPIPSGDNESDDANGA